MNNLSVVTITHNSEKTLRKCLTSIKNISDEIIVIDDNSSDKTVQIAKSFKAKVINRPLEDFSKQRNFGLSKAKSDWVFFLDSDEVVNPKLANEILKKIKNKNISGYYLKRTDIFLGKKITHGEAGNLRLLRLGRKKAGFWKRKVHEFWEIKGDKDELQNPIYHYSHENIEKFLESVNYFSSLHAKAIQKEGKRSNVFKIVVWPVGKFINSYILKLGFLDGVPGLIYAVMMSVHSFLAWSKLWIIQK